MLVLTRKLNESLTIGGLNGRGPPVVVTVLEIVKGRVKFGVTAPSEVPIDRSENRSERVTHGGSLTGDTPDSAAGAKLHVAP